MTGYAAPAVPDHADERWLLLLYQFPVGVVVFDDTGRVELINPAAVRLLAPALASGDHLDEIFPVLGRIAPQLVESIRRDTTRTGVLEHGRRVPVPEAGDAHGWRELFAARVDADRVLLTVVDVTSERRLAVREHEIAVELQAALLGRADPVAGLPVGVYYRAAAEEMAIGGDWYDVVDLAGDRVALIVGDVCGHHLAATAVMGQLRSAVRAIAPGCNGPAETLERTDDFARGVPGAECSTTVCVFLDRRTGILTSACAGHPPPLLVPAGAEPRFLVTGRRPPLAVPTTRCAVETQVQLYPGDLVVLYTDGLVERRDEDLDVGLARLRAAASRLSRLDPSELGVRLADAVLGSADPDDDVCVLAARYEPLRGSLHS